MPRRRPGSSRLERIGGIAGVDVLRLVYVGRITLVSGILLGAIVVWAQARPEQTLLATSMFAVALLVTGGSAWYTHLLRREPSRNFLYGQVVFDVLLVTGVVHITGGAASHFAWVYVLVISAGALLLPLPGGVLVGGLAAVLYSADVIWGQEASLTGGVLLQIGLFAVVALVTGVLGDRLRRAGLALGDAESELLRLRLDTGEILETIGTGVLTVDEEGRLVYLNPAAQAILGLDARQWSGAPVLEALEQITPGLADILRRSLEGGVTLLRQSTAASRGGNRLTLGVSTTLREPPAAPRTVTAIFQDITDQERIAALHLQAERLGAVAELSAAMAHEIKNPLASIRSAVEQLSRPSLQAEDRDTLIRMVVRESDRLSRLLSDFIDYSRVRIGALESIAVGDLVRECAALVQRHPEAEDRRIQIAIEGVDTGLRIPADGDLLHRALLNLLLNAVQHSPDGGTVHVSVADLSHRGRIRQVDVPNPVRIQVADDGSGVPEAVLSRIFDPFFTTRSGGSGLGLSVVHRAVEAHRGVILVDRGMSGGAEFNVYLPGTPLPAEVRTHV